MSHDLTMFVLLGFLDVSYINVLQVRLFKICSMFWRNHPRGFVAGNISSRFLLVILLPSCLKETVHLFKVENSTASCVQVRGFDRIYG